MPLKIGTHQLDGVQRFLAGVDAVHAATRARVCSNVGRRRIKHIGASVAAGGQHGHQAGQHAAQCRQVDAHVRAEVLSHHSLDLLEHMQRGPDLSAQGNGEVDVARQHGDDLPLGACRLIGPRRQLLQGDFNIAQAQAVQSRVA